jgi:dihydrodipicolinate synthase/N-acetylneuraminate lyase
MVQLFAPLIVPFFEDGRLDLSALQRNVQRYDDMPLDGYLVNGSSGEADMLMLEERTAVLSAVSDSTSRPLLAGVVATSTRDAVHQVHALGSLKLKAILLRTPSYYGGQLDQVEFFRVVADESPHPIMIYQIPQCTGVRLTGQELFELAQHPNIIGIKDSLGDLAMLNEKTWPSHFEYFLGASALIQPGLAAGAKGGILALANVVPELCRQLLEFCVDPMGIDSARKLQQQLIPLNRLLGGSRGFGLAGLKAACEMRGFEAGIPRSPLRPLSNSDRSTMEAVLAELLIQRPI